MIDDTAGRIVAETLVRQHRKLGGPADCEADLSRLTTELWQAMRAGDVCLPLSGRDEPNIAQSLLASPVVANAAGSATPGRPRPLVLTDKYLYTLRYWRAEQSLARSLIRRAAAETNIQVKPCDDQFSRQASDRQQQAVAQALSRKLLVLTGGPGTGKTFTLAAIVRAAAEQPDLMVAGAASVPVNTGTGARQAPFAIAIAAPTGKATARLAESIGAALGDRSDLSLEAMTLHRLLGFPGRSGADAENRTLPFDLVVVDECSMVDTLMAQRLVAGLAPHARLVLAGDRDQLASVQAGAFFSSLCTSEVPSLAGSRIVLDQNFRQRDAPEIVAWANAVRIGGLKPGNLPAHQNQVTFDDGGINGLTDRLTARLHPLIERAGSSSPDQLLQLHAEFLQEQALAMLRSGPLGVDAINEAVSRRLNPALADAWGSRWYPGRMVVVRRNAAHRELFNGDIGLCIALPAGGAESSDALRVAFPDGKGGVKMVMTSQMPLHADAWALSVHQAQGSDFESVLLLPAPLDHPLATREGLYTALTRARRNIRIYGAPDLLVSAAAIPMQRITGLPDALRRAESGQI